ncbi:MAG: hypothetical protein EBS36_05400 [Actinobacteria bacterium]|nr:hypothetical protein [Actinomycetota bacterium]NBY15006.1 hypothetical protein [Actinomycetota bacterium]
MKRNFLLIAMTFCLIATAPVSAQTPSPTPSPSGPVSAPLVCAPIATGIPEKVSEVKCPKGTLNLGRGPIKHGDQRPAKINQMLRNRFVAARTAAKQLGHSIGIRSGWRSWDTQEQMYQKALRQYKDPKIASRWVLPPEKSMHVWGVAIDVHFSSPQAKTWFRWNSDTFGLCRTYKNEWWHFEPIIAPGEKCPPMKPFAK